MLGGDSTSHGVSPHKADPVDLNVDPAASGMSLLLPRVPLPTAVLPGMSLPAVVPRGTEESPKKGQQGHLPCPSPGCSRRLQGAGSHWVSVASHFPAVEAGG